MHDNAVHCVEQPTFHKMMPGLNQKELLKQKQAKQQQHNDLPISNPCTDIKYKFMSMQAQQSLHVHPQTLKCKHI